MRNFIYNFLNGNTALDRLARVAVTVLVTMIYAKTALVFIVSSLLITFLMSLIGSIMVEELPIIIDTDENTMVCMEEAD